MIRYHEAPRLARGFTLLEMIVALAVVGLLIALAVPATGKIMEAVGYQSTLRNILSDLKASRTRAILAGKEVYFVIDLDERVFGTGKTQHKIPADLEVYFVAADSLVSNKTAAIAFYADGSSSGGSVFVVRKGGSGTQVRVDWLLGEIKPLAHMESL